MKKLLVLLGLMLIVSLPVFAACASRSPEKDSTGEGIVFPGVPSMPEQGPATPVERPQSEPAPPAPVVISKPGVDLGISPTDDRMIVRTGNIAMVVEDVQLAIVNITSMAEGMQGYVVSSQVWKAGEKLMGSISIRVPAGRYNDATRMLHDMAVDITSETSSSQDVTQEYVDLTARLDNLEATEAQLLTIMQKAETVEDILDVQRELSRVRGEIEQTKARMLYLERTSATSIIQISLEQASLQIDFTADKRIGVREGERIQFTLRQIAGGFPPYSYEWDFGDGNTSSDENPTHAYQEDGNYTVSLTVTDDKGNSDTQSRTNYINVLPGWNPGNIAGNAWNGMVTFGHALANIFIWLGVFSPVWITASIIVFVIIYWQRRNKKTG